MQFHSQPFKILVSSFVGAMSFSSVAIAAPSSVLNPCPRIYYVEPHNSLRAVPQGCPPNAVTQQLINQGRLPAAPVATQVTPIPIPLPEQQQTAITTISPQAGRVNVRLRNDTNTQVNYQVIGQTQERSLPGGQEVNLQNLPAPVTVTFVRPDGGFVRITPIQDAEAGRLAIALNEETGLNNSQTTLRIQNNGGVFAY